jgi:hypothetical protein
MVDHIYVAVVVGYNLDGKPYICCPKKGT